MLFEYCISLPVLYDIVLLIFVFQLDSGPHSSYYNLLNLFAYGTYNDYKGILFFVCFFIQNYELQVLLQTSCIVLADC